MCSERLVAKEEKKQVESMVFGAIGALRSHARIGPKAPIIVAVEACSGDSNYIAPLFIEADPVNLLVLSEIRSGKDFGVPKNKTTTSQMTTLMSHLLAQKNYITIPSDMIPFNTPYVAVKKERRDFNDMLAIQFASFGLDEHGSLNGKAGGGNDDLVITLMMAIYWMTRFVLSHNPDYLDFMDSYGLEMWKRDRPDSLILNDCDENCPCHTEMDKKRMRIESQPGEELVSAAVAACTKKRRTAGCDDQEGGEPHAKKRKT
jgi:hypothetical protein